MAEDTISAVTTALGEGAVGIVRISGPKALAVGETLFKAASGKALGAYPVNTLAYGHVYDTDGSLVDEVLAVYMRAPRSYTAEDVVEIQCHGGVQPLKKILQLTFAAGARPAEAGEFTKRAFLNGRIDLTQAEAVMDIIRSRSEASLKLAARQQQGQLAGELRTLRKQLVDIVVNLEAVIDYPEEDIEDVTYGRVQESLSTVCSGIEHLLAHAHTGKILREGLRTAIVGRPNVGKSSLTNALLGEERNIVTPIAGTTRDAIHSRYNKYGLDFYLVDTAGMRKKGKVTEDLEFYSVMRSIRAIEESDVCILMLDAQQGLESQDLNIHNLIVRNRKGCVIVVNKWDLVEKGNNTMKEWKEALAKKLAPFNDIPIIFTSVLNKQRILEVLQTAIRVYENRKRRVATSALNDYLLPIIENYPPPATKGKYIKIKYVMQLPTPTPQFACFVNLPQYIKDPYRRFLENKIREEWDFSGVPIQIYFRQK